MSIRVAINGFGRIGRLVFRVMLERKDKFEIVAINDLADAQGLAHMLKYDTVHGRFPGEVRGDDSQLQIDDESIRLLRSETIDNLPWKDLHG